MRPSSIRTGTSTWTSRNGCIRTWRMYCSRLIRLAARSNWLATMDFPDIARDDWPVAVNEPPLDSGDRETAAGQAGRRVECFGQGVAGFAWAVAAAAGVGEHTDRVGARAGRIARLLEHEHEARRVFCHGAGDGAPRRVGGLWPLGHDERADRRVESDAGDEGGTQRVRQGGPDGQGGPGCHDLAQPPPPIPRPVAESGPRPRRH